MDEDQESGRSYSSEMSRIISDRLDRETGADLVPAILAWDIVQSLMSSDPDLLSGWLHENAKAFLSDLLRRRMSSERSRARLNASRSAFAGAAKAFENGHNGAMGHWTTVRYAVDDGNTQRLLLDMNRDDLNYAASRYGRSARAFLLEEAFLRALAGRVGHQTVGEVFSERDIDSMYSSITGGTNVAAS